MQNYNHKEFVTLQVNKHITRLFKTFLDVVEDIDVDNASMLKKVEEKTSEDFSSNVNYLTESRREQIRKRILDAGNECTRETLNFLELFDYNLNMAKVKNELNKRKTIKKFTTGGYYQLSEE